MTNQQFLILGAATVAGAAFILWQGKKAVVAVGEAVNPLNDENIFAAGIDNLGGKILGDVNFSLGGWLWDITNEDPLEGQGL